jgi:hypothetical protein
MLLQQQLHAEIEITLLLSRYLEREDVVTISSVLGSSVINTTSGNSTYSTIHTGDYWSQEKTIGSDIEASPEM